MKVTTIIQGSLHKFANQGEHNYDDFTYSRLTDTLDHIGKEFSLDLSKCKLQNLEVGLNIVPCLKTQELLENIVIHKGEEFKHVSMKSGNYRQAIHTAYYLKAYDKALHYNLPDPLFRWEIKMMRSVMIKRHDVTYLSDLYDKRNLERLLKDLINKWQETLVLDPTIRPTGMTGSEYDKLKTWMYTDYWLKLRKNYSGDKRHLFTKELKQYKNIVHYHSDNIQQQIAEILKEKMNYCLTH